MSWFPVKARRRTHELGEMHLDQADDPAMTYFQRVNAGALPSLGYPFAEAGCLEVLPFSSSPDRVIQRYTTFSKLKVFLRSRINGVWSAWREVA